MGRLSRKWIGVAIIGASPGVAAAQIPLSLDSAAAAVQKDDIGGMPAIDIIHLRAIGPGAPLRYGNVVPKSERVQLDSELLTSGSDYMMDYATGVVYLKRAQRAGQTLTVSYRYKDGAATSTATTPFTGGTFKYAVAPGSLNMLMGLGVTERALDGSVAQTNIMGWQNSFNLGPSGKANGLLIFGDRARTDSESGMQMNMDPTTMSAPVLPGQPQLDDGKSQLIVQNLEKSFGNTKISVDYQDISQNFSNFGTIKANGYDDATIAKLTAERGLTRTGFGLQNLSGFNMSMRDVKDQTGGISWQNLGYAAGAFKLDVKSQKVDSTFTRFADISEADKAQLQLETGMSRQNIASSFASKVGNFTLNTKKVNEDQTGQSLNRNEFALDTGKVKFNLGQQDVSTGFTRFGSLMADEQLLYGKEAGLSRQWMGLQATLGATSIPISFAQSTVASPTGKFESDQQSVAGKGWSLDHISQKVDSGFGRIDSLQDAEIANHITNIGKMYGTTADPAAERGFFVLSNGLSRDYTKVAAEPFKDWKFSMDRLAMQGALDKAEVNNVNVTGKNMNAWYKRQSLGSQFNELATMLNVDRAQLGTVSGLDRTDMGMNATFGASTFNFDQMKATAPTGNAGRTQVGLKNNSIDVQVTTREVSPGFTNVNQMVDTDKDLLAAMTGFKQTEGRIAWKLNASLDVTGYLSESQNGLTNEDRKVSNLIVNWKPDAKTGLNYTRFSQKNADPLSMLFVNELERISLTRDLGRTGTVAYTDERVKYNGTQTTLIDWHKQYLAYETKVNDKTTYRTEQTRTDFENGDKENINSNTVSTELTKKVGVSLNNTLVDRGGDERDENKKNYGVWVDIGNGMRVSYGYARQLTGLNGGSTATGIMVGPNASPTTTPDQVGTATPGTVGGFNVGGGYGVNTWDDQYGRTQSFSNVNISTAKPFDFLGMKAVDVKVALDTSADAGNWLKENRQMSFAGTIAGTRIGMEYKSQVDATNARGIDRSYFMETAKNDKSWLYAALKYKIRTMPWDEIIAIRDFNITAKPLKNMELTHQMVTNPEIFQADAFLGSVPQASTSTKWALNYNANKNFTFGGSYQELTNDLVSSKVQTAGVNMKLNEAKGSPISLFYGLEHNSDLLQNRMVQRYSIQYTQKPGPNQQMSLFFGNVSYDGTMNLGEFKNNFTARLDYQFRF